MRGLTSFLQNQSQWETNTVIMWVSLVAHTVQEVADEGVSAFPMPWILCYIEVE